ncbi:MAG: hypothetical protein EZS28_024949 [Streblomastix strix]|uniref:Uncharacterized protein n=1 Tax=Streblomastix strix TaxID=222440 RepID=A0A5J4VAJ4_9EUKA|nr:MAG: hypothetical protein EZS28_024949 [Streblomastix strix]
MIKGIERNSIRVSKTKKQMSEIKHKELTDEDKIRLQLIDDAISRITEGSGINAIKTMPQISLERRETIDDTSKSKENPTQIGNEIIQVAPEQLILTEQKITKYKSKYNKDKYKQVDRTTAQVDSEQAVKNTYLSHPNLEVMKLIIDYLWKTVTTRKRGDDFILSSDNFIKLWSLIAQENEDDIEIVLEEPLMRSHSCIGKSYKKKDLIRVMDILIKNVSISVIDNVLFNSIEKLYRINKDFTTKILAQSEIVKGGTSNQILLANGDTIDKNKLDYEPIENARYSSIAYGMYEQRIWGTLTSQNSRVYISLQITHSDPNTVWQSGYTLFSIVDNAIKPKFSGTPTNIPLNAVTFAQKVIGYPICWNGAIPIECFINPNGNVIINTMCQLTIWEAAIKYACESKICR